MLAVITTVIAGGLIFLRAGFLVATVSVFCGYAAFVAYAYVRSRMWMKDPAMEEALAAGRAPKRAIRIERTVASILIPPVTAFLVDAALFHLLRH